MALEIERRFLIAADADGWLHRAQAPQPLRQAYLAASADGVTVRVRLQEGGKAWLTLKAAADSSGLVRHEFEYAIPVVDAEALWSLAPHRLAKTRYALDLDGGDWVVDCFEAENAPLLIAEVELPRADIPLAIPEWCGQEITGDGRWSNAQLAHRPLQHWSELDRRRFGFP